MKILFRKYQSCGNDFIVGNQKLDEDMIRRLCDRRYGIGADGYLLVDVNRFEMRIFNADGSEAQMCGNGLRCFIHALYDLGMHRKTYLAQTKAGAIRADVVSINPFVVSFALPVHLKSKDVYEVSGVEHYVIQNMYSDAKAYEHYRKRKCNINFLELLPSNRIRVSTYERGVGKTLACGTGSCATATFAYDKHLINEDVIIQYDKDSAKATIIPNGVILQGESKFVYKGEINIENS